MTPRTSLIAVPQGTTSSEGWVLLSETLNKVLWSLGLSFFT